MFYENTYCSFDKIILGRTIYTKGKLKNLEIYWTTDIWERYIRSKLLT